MGQEMIQAEGRFACDTILTQVFKAGLLLFLENSNPLLESPNPNGAPPPHRSESIIINLVIDDWLPFDGTPKLATWGRLPHPL